MNKFFSGVSIRYSKGVVPAHHSAFDDEISNYGPDIRSSLRLKKVFQYNKHHICPSSVTGLDLAISAFSSLLSSSDLCPSDIDAVIYVTQTPEYPVPASSCILHGVLALREDCYVQDINDGCAGFIKAFSCALSLVESFNLDNVAIVCADSLSHRISPHDRNSYPLVGDAATVVIVSPSIADTNPSFIDIRHHGSKWSSLRIPHGGARNPITSQSFQYFEDSFGNKRKPVDLEMNGEEVFSFTQTTVPSFIDDFLSSNQLDVHSFGRIYFHQPNLFILKKLIGRFKLDPKKVPSFVAENLGNSSSCTIPLLLAGDKLDEAEKESVLMCGFGIGLTWGLIHTNLKHLKPLGISYYDT